MRTKFITVIIFIGLAIIIATMPSLADDSFDEEPAPNGVQGICYHPEVARFFYPCRFNRIIDPSDWTAINKAMAFATTMDSDTVVRWSNDTNGNRGTLTVLEVGSKGACSRFKITEQDAKEVQSFIRCQGSSSQPFILMTLDGTKPIYPSMAELEKKVDQGNKYVLFDAAFVSMFLLSEKNDTDALDLLQKASEQGLAVAQYCYGEILIGFYEDASTSQIRKGINFLEKSAEQGFPLAQFFLGSYYYHGKESALTQDRKKADYWWGKLAEQDNTLAKGLVGAIPEIKKRKLTQGRKDLERDPIREGLQQQEGMYKTICKMYGDLPQFQEECWRYR